jgi:hypothetical protein
MDLFLLGAGFNVDAGRCRTPEGTDCHYPLVADTAKLFDSSQFTLRGSVEDLFLEAERRGDNGPMDGLAARLTDADYFLAYKQLAVPEHASCYSQFFDRFAGATFLTFTYDSLPEILLFGRERWFPDDGYGVEVETKLQSLAPETFVRKPSSSPVLHLHGSFCLGAANFEIRPDAGDSVPQLVHRPEPRFGFDPESLACAFFPYARVLWDTGFSPLRERVIAPVPDKAEPLTAEFIQKIYQKACAIVRESGALVAIGYSFNPHDRASYGLILEALTASRERRLLIVSPQANVLVERIGHEWPHLRVGAVAKTLKGWADDLFRENFGKLVILPEIAK